MGLKQTRNCSCARVFNSVARSFERSTNKIYSAVPNFASVLMPETLLKKRKTDAKSQEEKQSKAAELRKVC